VTCPETAPALGAYVLGALEPDERRRFEEHLGRCPLCTAELAEFAALPSLLDQVRPEDLQPIAVTPSPELFDRVAAAARPARRPAGPKRWFLVAAAVLAVLGAGVGVTVWLAGDAPRTVSAAAGPVHTTVTVSEAGDGSALDVRVDGLPPGQECHLVAVDEDGVRYAAGYWHVSSDGDGEWRGWAKVDDAAVDEVLLLGDDGEQLARLVF
jgi:hypothetical protein